MRDPDLYNPPASLRSAPSLTQGGKRGDETPAVTPSVLLPTVVGQQDSSLERAPKMRNYLWYSEPLNIINAR